MSTSLDKMAAMDIQTQLELNKALVMHQCIADQLAGSYSSDDRRALFAAFLSLAQSHHEAILLLATRERLIGSAFALFRPMVEVAYRGLFAAFLATDREVEAIKIGKEPYPHFNELAADLDEAFKTNGLFKQFAGQSWKILNGYTHGGLEQLTRRIDQHGVLGDHFELQEVQNLLTSSTSLLTRTAIPFLNAVKHDNGADVISLKFLELYPIAVQKK